MTADESPSLDELAEHFADRLTDLTRGVLGDDSPPFVSVNQGNHVRVTPISDDELARRIPIRINGEVVLSLGARYRCCWDVSRSFLAADQTDIHLFFEGSTDPLLRLEYVRRSRNPPGAHMQVHAHRDEWAYLLRLSEKGRPDKRLARRKLPRLAEMHLPVGGHRMRPVLEDVLLFLERELAIDVVPGWDKVLKRHLEDWRRLQLRSAVRDAPEEAVTVLRSLGYTVETPVVPAPRPVPDTVKLFWP
ncbi:hypothetical protein [Streptomyces sp. NPDC049881]|uniref:hypothetical protein n=1 Tax=Streptomyces sp. NPDC049881 TaxID=3155778 RepID=UPI00343AF7EF